MARNPFVIEDEEKGTNWQKEYVGMPECKNTVIRPHKSVTMHFRTKEDYEAFQKLIGQSMTEKTKSAWHPALTRGTSSLLRYVDDES